MKYIRLNWRDQIPLSNEYDDIYYSTDDGFSETTHVFISGNQLINRWKNLTNSFSIAETGFGTGLNFLTTWYYWHNYRSKLDSQDQWLHYVSIEKNPIHPQDIQKSYQNWSQLIPFGDQLIEKYPEAIRGFHSLSFPKEKISLTLIWEEAEIALEQLNESFDVWYLDGFNPSKNPELWNENIIKLISNQTKLNGTLATFTVARKVKDHLEKSGFKIEKKPGFGKKREMLTAVLEKKPLKINSQPWYDNQSNQSYSQKKAIIIGAGLAGCHTAYHLNQKGWSISLIDQENQIASHGSGNDVGILFPYLSSEWDYKTSFYLQAYLYHLQFLKDFDPKNEIHQSCGMIWLPRKDKDLIRFEKILKNLELSENILTPFEKSNSNFNQDGLYFPKGTWIKPQNFCEKLINSIKNIKLHLQKKIKKISYENSSWKIYDQNSKIVDEAPVLILCQGFEKPLGYDYPFMKVKGQITSIPENPQLKNLSQLLCYGGYTTPSINQKHHIGASFHINYESEKISDEDHQQNLETLNYYLDKKITHPSEIDLQGRVSFRNVTHDRFPVIGAVPNKDFYNQSYQDLHHGKHWKKYPPAQYQNGLYINSSHGSRGLLSTCLGSHFLSQLINKEPICLPQDQVSKLHPGRFLIQSFKRK